jgi:hypothetical protein
VFKRSCLSEGAKGTLPPELRKKETTFTMSLRTGKPCGDCTNQNAELTEKEHFNGKFNDFTTNWDLAYKQMNLTSAQIWGFTK